MGQLLVSTCSHTLQYYSALSSRSSDFPLYCKLSTHWKVEGMIALIQNYLRLIERSLSKKIW